MRKLAFLLTAALALGSAGCFPPLTQPYAEKQEQEIPSLPLEKRLLDLVEQDNFNLAEAGFIVSGVRNEKELNHYMKKFDNLIKKISQSKQYQAASSKEEKAKAIHDWFWNTGTKKKQIPIEPLTTFIDNGFVGNCFNFSYTNEALGFGFRTVEAPMHVYSVIITKDRHIQIENLERDGFDVPYIGDIKIVERKKLVQKYADNLAMQCITYGDDKTALALRKASALINPEVITLDSIGRLTRKLYGAEKALKTVEEILEKHPQAIPGLEKDEYFSRFMARLNLDAGKLEGAITYIQMAVKSNPKEPLNWYVLANALTAKKEYQAALVAYEKAKKVNTDGFFNFDADITKAKQLMNSK